MKQAGRRLDFAPSANVVSHGNKCRPQSIFYGSIESAIPENPLVGPNISGLSVMRANIGNFCQILGSQFWGLGALNQKSKKKQFCRVPHGELTVTAKEWLDSIDKQKRRSNLKLQRDGQTYRQTESTTKK